MEFNLNFKRNRLYIDVGCRYLARFYKIDILSNQLAENRIFQK